MKANAERRIIQLKVELWKKIRFLRQLFGYFKLKSECPTTLLIKNTIYLSIIKRLIAILEGNLGLIYLDRIEVPLNSWRYTTEFFG